MRPARCAALAFAALAVAACSARGPAGPSAETPRAPVQQGYQLGIDLDFYWHPGQDVPGLVAREAAYARALGANSVLISFPFYTDGRTAFAGAATPPLAELREAVAAVRSQGLTAGVRPLLNEANLPHSRPKFLPGDVAGWLSSYRALIVPYARAAQQAGAARFYTGTELSEFAHAPEWPQVTRAVSAVFKGQLYFSANWAVPADTARLPGSGGPGVAVAADAYQGMPVSPAAFTAGWEAKAAALPRGTVMSEVGIAARQGAQSKPYEMTPSDATADPQLQAAWFTAACDAVQADGLGGIYFWAIYVGQPLNEPPGPQAPGQFTDAPGASAIGSCFARLRAAR